jgi:long-chain acyl-CoA synthetase
MVKANLVQLIEESIRKHWDYPAFCNYKAESMTYRDVAEKIRWMHELFKELGIKRGDKIALIGKNSVTWAVTYLATVSYGAVIVPGLPDFHSDDLHHIVNHSDAVLLFVADDNHEKLDDAEMHHLTGIFSLNDFRVTYDPDGRVRPALDRVNARLSEPDRSALTRDSFSLPKVGNEELASIVYTSGTTGFSKGVMLLHNSLSANVHYAITHFQLKPTERIVSFLPLAHAFGCAFDFLYPLTCGAFLVFLNKIPSPNIVLQAFQENRPRLVMTVPLVMEKIYRSRIRPTLDKKTISLLLKVPFVGDGINGVIKHKLVEALGGNFNQVVIGGAALNTEVQQFLKRIGFRFTVGYGMTECGPLISYCYPEEFRLFSVGKVVDTLDIKIDHPDHNGVGEICVRGENVMVGYYKNDEATRETIDEEGWLHSGDLGYIDADGYIYIRGRSKTMYLGPSGENIYPEQIESKLNSMPLVSESLVIDRAGKLVALVYPDREAADKEGVDEHSLLGRMEENRKLLNQLMPSYINVSRIELYPEEFEKTPTKKIKRFLYTVSEVHSMN